MASIKCRMAAVDGSGIFLSRSGAGEGAQAATARLPQRRLHVPRSDPAPHRQISHRVGSAGFDFCTFSSSPTISPHSKGSNNVTSLRGIISADCRQLLLDRVRLPILALFDAFELANGHHMSALRAS